MYFAIRFLSVDDASTHMPTVITTPIKRSSGIAMILPPVLCSHHSAPATSHQLQNPAKSVLGIDPLIFTEQSHPKNVEGNGNQFRGIACHAAHIVASSAPPPRAAF